MKIAVPTRDGKVDDHFGHCAYYTIYIIENNSIASTEMLESPQGCGCKSNIASILKDLGVVVMLAGNMGGGAKNVLANHSIEVITGCSGNTDELVKSYLAGEVVDSGAGCAGHGEDHVCSHIH